MQAKERVANNIHCFCRYRDFLLCFQVWKRRWKMVQPSSRHHQSVSRDAETQTTCLHFRLSSSLCNRPRKQRRKLASSQKSSNRLASGTDLSPRLRRARCKSKPLNLKVLLMLSSKTCLQIFHWRKSRCPRVLRSQVLPAALASRMLRRCWRTRARFPLKKRPSFLLPVQGRMALPSARVRMKTLLEKARKPSNSLKVRSSFAGFFKKLNFACLAIIVLLYGLLFCLYIYSFFTY